MPSQIPKERTIAGLREVWASIDGLAAGLAAAEWRSASPLPGWDVQANIVHMLGTEVFLLGRQPTASAPVDALEHVRNPIGEMNEHWVASYEHASPEVVLDAFRELTGERLRLLEAMSQDDWDAVGVTPVGQESYGRFMQIRVFDCWMHEQDVRAAVDRPGHESGIAVEVALDEMSTAMGFVVGKRAGARPGSTVTFDLTGPAARQIHVAVGERAEVVPELAGPATATITLPVVSFGRIAGGRLDAPRHAGQATLAGDTELAERVLHNLSYTI